MPQLSLLHFAPMPQEILVQRCESTDPWFSVKVASHSEEGKTYTVLIPYPNDLPEEYPCECRGFVFRGRCRHQLEAREQRCGWEADVGPEEQTKEQEAARICPRCGKTTSVSVEWV